MALINCPECGKQISDKAPACPNCGYPMDLYFQKKESEEEEKLWESYTEDAVFVVQKKAAELDNEEKNIFPIYLVGPDRYPWIKAGCSAILYGKDGKRIGGEDCLWEILSTKRGWKSLWLRFINDPLLSRNKVERITVLAPGRNKKPAQEPVSLQEDAPKPCPNCSKPVPFYLAKCPDCGEKVNPELPVSETMKTWKVGQDKIEVKCESCGKIYLYEKKWFYPADDPRGQIPNTLLRCPECGTESRAGERLPNEGVVEYESFNPEEPPKQKGISIEQKYGLKTTFHQVNSFKRSPPKTQEPSSQGARCPHCGSTSIQAVKKGFGLGKAAAGGILLGPIGLLGGAIGSNKIQRVCLNCGKKF